VCREFGISRKTGYKIFDRYKEHGLEALSDRSRRRSSPFSSISRTLAGVAARHCPARTRKQLFGVREQDKAAINRLLGASSSARTCGTSLEGNPMKRREFITLLGGRGGRLAALGARAAAGARAADRGADGVCRG
jgi:hypothetical protein